MAMQEKSGSSDRVTAVLDPDAAEAAADAFRPAWAADDGDEDDSSGAAPPVPSPQAPGQGSAVAVAPTVIVGAPVISLGTTEPSSTAPPVPAPPAAAPPAAAPPVGAPVPKSTVLGMISPVASMQATAAASAPIVAAPVEVPAVATRAPEPSSMALDSASVIEISAAPPKDPIVAPAVPAPAAGVEPAPAAPARVSTRLPAVAKDPFAADAVRSAPKPSDPELDAQFVVKKKSGSGLYIGIGVVCVALVGGGLFLKLGSGDETTPKTATTTPLGQPVTSPSHDIPPPPPRDEIVPPPTAVKAADPAGHNAKAEPVPAKGDAPQKAIAATPAKADPPPPKTVAAAPQPHHAPAARKEPPAPPPAAVPKTPPKASGGGIVRDSPF